MMDYTKSYTSEWRIFRVNRDTWADDEKLSGIVSVDVLKTGDGNNLESGSMEITGDFEPGYYRIVLTAEQGGEVERVDVATLYFSEKGGEHDYGIDTYDVDGYSVLYPASKTSILTGEYAPAGTDGVQYAANLLASAINAPIETSGSYFLNDHVVHEIGSSVLSAVWSVLNAGPDGGYVIQIDGRGVVHIGPMPSDPALTVDSAVSKLLMNGIKYNSDESDIPNRYIIIDGINITVAENNSLTSPTSAINRGYYVDTIDTSPTPINGETYSAYADRMLKKESVLNEEYNYEREFAPDVYPYSIIKASIDGLDGDFRVRSQSITCKNGITVSEKVIKEIKLYE